MRPDDWCLCGPDDEDEDDIEEEDEDEDDDTTSVQEFNDNLDEAVYGDE